MQFDLRSFLREGRTTYQRPISMDLSGWDFPGYRVPQQVCGSFTAIPTPYGVEMEMKVTAEAEAECARCLTPVREVYSLERRWDVRERDFEDPEFELPVDEKGILDLDQLVFEELVLEIPSVHLCSEDCEGLCPVCGKPKADGCTCVQDTEAEAPVDDRLAILKQLLN